MSDEFDCIVVGAGIAGLMAAGQLQAAGRTLVVLDKGRGVGGRMATRRFEDATFDHGAQFMTVRSALLQQHVDTWREAGLVSEWYRGQDGGHPRLRGTLGMAAIPKALAVDLNVRLQSQVTEVRGEAGRVVVELADGASLTGASVLMTPPVPQSLVLLAKGCFPLSAHMLESLASLAYDPCIAVMARLDAASGLPAPGILAGIHAPIAWLADNQQKGVSAVPAVTLHADASFSKKHWSIDRREAGQIVLDHAQQFLQARVVDYQVHGWRYSQPIRLYPEPCAVVSESPLVVLAGDAFRGPRVEGAALSGLAAADRILQLPL